MKKKYLIILIGLIFITGCNKKTSEPKKPDLDLKKGKITVVCTSNSLGDKYAKLYLTHTMNFDKNKIIMNNKVEIKEVIKDSKVYKERKKKYQEIEKQIQNDQSIISQYTYDDKNKTIQRIEVIKEIDWGTLSEEQKENYNIKASIKELEKEGSTCKIEGATRKELGLK